MPELTVDERADARLSGVNDSLIGIDKEDEGKASEISRACHDRNLDELVHLADSAGGLLNDSLRRIACTTNSEPQSSSSIDRNRAHPLG